MNEDVNILAFCAMRYALGRKTYAVDYVCRALTNQKKNLHEDTLTKMSQEIRRAIMEGNAGMPMDVARWVDVLEDFK